ncbi:MAG: tetratricopeptide repeat protein [Reyranellaceae bacterium]
MEHEQGQAATPGTTLAAALQHHQAGRLAQAEQLYRQILAADPRHADALHLLGVIASQAGAHQAAIDLIGRAIAITGNVPNFYVHRAIALKALGRLQDAVDSYRRALALAPDYAMAHNNLGLTLQAKGQLTDALQCYDTALALEPGSADCHRNRADVLLELGRLAEAIESYDRALELDPSLVNALIRRGNALGQQGNWRDALSSYDRAISVRPDFVDVHCNRGFACMNLGDLDAAIASYDRALALQPDRVDAHSSRADILYRQGKPAEALAGYARAGELGLDTVALHHNWANALRDLGRYDEALTSYHRALAIEPNLVEAHYNRGNTLNSMGRLDEALASYDRALALAPDFVPAHHHRGTVLRNQGRHSEAIESYRRAVTLDPESAAAHAELGVTLRDRGLLDEAITSFTRASALVPGSFEYACLQKLALPIILDSTRGIAGQREHYRRSIDELMAHPGALDDIESTNTIFSFYLAYHDSDDRAVLQALCRLYRAKAPALTYEAPHLREWRPPAGNRRIRIGFLSAYFRSHTIEKLNRGLIRHLDPHRFDVVLLRPPASPLDAASERLDKLASRSLMLPHALAQQHLAIADEQLDILFYPDIGMDRESYLLAFARLAPVQAVGWGHPITTGLDTLDYFVSARGLEPPDADLHYIERLVRLNRLPCCYDVPTAPEPIPGREECRLPATGTLYGCPQSLFKLHPDFDALLADIAAGDPDGHIVLLEGTDSTLTDMVRQRWTQHHPALIDRVKFLPRQPADRFLALMSHFDVVLDPLHFGSGNTLYEAMLFGTPIVTWPGRFMRGRVVAAAYRQMGLADPPIAATLQDYAPLALALGRDPARREALRRASRAAASALFADIDAVREFESFVEAALDAAGRGEKIAAGWQPPEKRRAA